MCVRVCLCVGGETVIWGEYVPRPTCGKRRAPEDAASQAGFGVSDYCFVYLTVSTLLSCFLE